MFAVSPFVVINPRVKGVLPATAKQANPIRRKDDGRVGATELRFRTLPNSARNKIGVKSGLGSESYLM